jgi:hypothetical protein
VTDHEGEIVEQEVGGTAQGADHGALLLAGLPRQLVRPGGMVEAISPSPRWRHLRMVSVLTP